MVACNQSSKHQKDENNVKKNSIPGYTMLFQVEPAIPTADSITSISLRPVKSGSDSIVSLEIQHDLWKYHCDLPIPLLPQKFA